MRPEERQRYGERIILRQIDWTICGDPYFYENRHLEPKLVKETIQKGGEEYRIYYNTTKFSGKKLVVKPGQTFDCVERGAYNILVWQGSGRYDGHEIEAGKFDLDFCLDELLITYEKAITRIPVKNTGTQDLVIIKFFGPDINSDVPKIPQYKMV